MATAEVPGHSPRAAHVLLLTGLSTGKGSSILPAKAAAAQLPKLPKGEPALTVATQPSGKSLGPSSEPQAALEVEAQTYQGQAENHLPDQRNTLQAFTATPGTETAGWSWGGGALSIPVTSLSKSPGRRLHAGTEQQRGPRGTLQKPLKQRTRGQSHPLDPEESPTHSITHAQAAQKDTMAEGTDGPTRTSSAARPALVYPPALPSIRATKFYFQTEMGPDNQSHPEKSWHRPMVGSHMDVCPLTTDLSDGHTRASPPAPQSNLSTARTSHFQLSTILN